MAAGDGSSIGGKHRVAVIDAQPLFRLGVVNTLNVCSKIDVVAEGGSAMDALQIAAKYAPDIMLIDLAIPGGGAQALSSIVRLWPAIRLVVLTASEREEDVSAALQTGAKGYILKGVDGGELVAAIRSIASGELHLTAALGARLLARVTTPVGPELTVTECGDLTPREVQILSKVSNGSTNKEIARLLNIREKTVKHYMTSLMAKLKVRNRVEAVMAARNRMKALV